MESVIDVCAMILKISVLFNTKISVLFNTFYDG